jgi:hypothetical protein
MHRARSEAIKRLQEYGYRAPNLRLVNDAYLYLLELIEQGVEYPDAEFKAAERFDVDASDIREMYDGETL